MTQVILCPTRGGLGSYPNQDRAIAIAKERHAGLLFLYVNNVQFMGLTARPIALDIEEEMHGVGEFLLAMAQERAQREGVDADAIVRRGAFHKVLAQVIGEYHIQTVVMGVSTGDTGSVTQEYIDKLVEAIGDEVQVEFIVVDQGEIVEIYHSHTTKRE